MSKKVGFVGLGAMGAQMAGNLVKAGFDVVGFDINPDARVALKAAGGGAADTAAAAAKGADLFVLMVVNAAQARDVLFARGALDALPEGATVALMATCLRDEVEEIAGKVVGSGRGFVDAPVSGGVAGAREASLTIMAAGDPASVDKARGVFEAVGGRLFVVGETPGQGAVAKTVNQLLCGVHIAAAAEAFSLAERLGLDMRAMLDIVSGSSASSWMINDRGPRMISDGDEITSAVDIFVKDLGIVLETGRGAKAALPLAAAAFQMFLASSGRGEGRLDDSQVIRSYRALGGVSS